MIFSLKEQLHTKILGLMTLSPFREAPIRELHKKQLYSNCFGRNFSKIVKAIDCFKVSTKQ
jgi:hypothetical protein